MSLPSTLTDLKLRVSTGTSPNVQTFEQTIPSVTLGSNSVQITNSQLLSAFNSKPSGTIFTPSIEATYGNISSVSTPSIVPNFVPRKITPNLSLGSLPTSNPLGSSFSLSVSTNSNGAVTYSSSNTSVATVSSSGLVTIVGFGTTLLTVSKAASADGVYTSASANATLNVVAPQWRQLGGNILGQASNDRSGSSVIFSSGGSRVAIGSPLNDVNGSDSGQVRIYDLSGNTWTQVGVDILGQTSYDQSGTSVSFSSNGSRVAIGAPGYDNNKGCVRVYDLIGSTWTQVGGNITNGPAPAGGYLSGASVSLSSSGSRVAIGEPYGASYGQVRVYEYNSGTNTWTKVGAEIMSMGYSLNYGGNNATVCLSSNGNIVAVGAFKNNFTNGNVRVYEYNSDTNTWTKIGGNINGLDLSSYNSDDAGKSVSLSSNGRRVAIGAPKYDNYKGCARIYDLIGNIWTQVGGDIIGEAGGYLCGESVSLSSSGSRVAIGAPGYNSSKGRVYIYDLIGSTWTKVDRNIDGNFFSNESGRSVSLSSSGSRVAIGAPYDSGYVHVYELS